MCIKCTKATSIQCLIFFLLISDLLANAYIQVLAKQTVLALCVASFGVLMSILSCLIHTRSRELLDVIEAGLEIQERALFSADSPGFLTARPKHKSPFHRYKYQFPFMYIIVLYGFVAMSIYAACEVPAPRTEGVLGYRHTIESFLETQEQDPES
jgi:hypothetical protein